MGMFKLFKKDKSDDNFEPREGSNFSLMVEDAFLLKGKDGVVVVGNVHGEIRVGDVAYVHHHAKPMVPVKVRAIEIGKDKSAESAENQHVALLVEGVTTREDLPKYAVLSPKKPQGDVAEKELTENPFLLGLSMEYIDHAREEQYLNTLIYAATHSRFITPVKISEVAEKPEVGADEASTGTMVEFSSLTSPGMPGITIFPVFTDYKALEMSGVDLEGEDAKEIMILNFPDLVNVVRSGYAGAVINPHGPVPVFFPMSLVDHITSLEGYKKEFGA